VAHTAIFSGSALAASSANANLEALLWVFDFVETDAETIHVGRWSAPKATL